MMTPIKNWQQTIQQIQFLDEIVQTLPVSDVSICMTNSSNVVYIYLYPSTPFPQTSYKIIQTLTEHLKQYSKYSISKCHTHPYSGWIEIKMEVGR